MAHQFIKKTIYFLPLELGEVFANVNVSIIRLNFQWVVPVGLKFFYKKLGFNTTYNHSSTTNKNINLELSQIKQMANLFLLMVFNQSGTE